MLPGTLTDFKAEEILERGLKGTSNATSGAARCTKSHKVKEYELKKKNFSETGESDWYDQGCPVYLYILKATSALEFQSTSTWG